MIESNLLIKPKKFQRVEFLFLNDTIPSMSKPPIDAASPYHENAVNVIYELLFCDKIELYRTGHSAPDTYPWDILFAPAPDIKDLKKIILDDRAETRVKILAYDALRQREQPVEEKELLGVIVEVGLDEGLDVLASYQDGTARYINYTGKMILWDTADGTSLEITAQLFRDSLNIVHRIGPWNNPRKPRPEKGNVRISFLVSDGMYFGEGPINVLFNDALAAPALQSATALMNYMTNRVLIKK